MKKFLTGGALLLPLIFINTAPGQEKFIDILHSRLSQIVHSTVERFDTFFADQRIKEETKAYLRIRTGFRYETVPDFQTFSKIDFKIRLAKIEKSLGMLIKDYTEKISPEEGARPPSKNKKLFRYRFSVGLTSSPKIYAKYDIYNLPVVYKRWEITVYQRFKAERKLTENILLETTQIYIDRLISHETVWRIYLDRYKYSNVPYQVLNYSTSVRRFTTMWGKSVASEVSAGMTQSKLVNGKVSLYTLQSNFRINFYKNWAFFHINTGVNWPVERGFKGTPFIQMFLEFYFGKN